VDLKRKSGTPVAPVLVAGMDRDFALQVHLLPIIIALEGVVS